jgi:alcohol dehydrogenase, propanol-preferring
MRAMVFRKAGEIRPGAQPLAEEQWPIPTPAEGQVLIQVTACGVCHTELDIIEGRAEAALSPLIPGHQVVGNIILRGAKARRFEVGARIGVAWIFAACGQCGYCRTGDENLCERFVATGKDAHGGYAEYMVVSESFAYPIPTGMADAEAAPLLCAGAIGQRSLTLANPQPDANLGLMGFGASAHLVLQLVRGVLPGVHVCVFARDQKARDFARELGAHWVGGIEDVPPDPLDAIIDTTPAWRPVIRSLRCLAPGGRLIINALRKEAADKSALLELEYEKDLWKEKSLKSVANVTRRDVERFLKAAAEIPIRPNVRIYRLPDANQALMDLKQGGLQGAAVLKP